MGPAGPQEVGIPDRRLVVVACTDAFERVWGELAARLGVELATFDDLETAAGERGFATLVAAGGAEPMAHDLLLDALRAGIEAPMVVASEPDHRLAIRLVRSGAMDYFALPGDVERLEEELLRLLERSRGRPTPASGEYDFSSLVGEHPSLESALDRAARVIPADRTTVLILGETGTGKELVARAIHDNGPRADEPFVAVNCSAIPGTLLESELFGHEKGAFTDARTSKPGLFEMAHGGTVFLDEISTMPFELQGKLLRFLETREVRRVGGLRTNVVDVRVLAAANEDLRALAEEGDFREDLYYRLAVVPIELPPLRERGDDVLALARHFVGELAEAYGLEVPELDAGARAALERHRWPGNVRELRNAIERGLLLGPPGRIGEEDLALEPPRADARFGGSEHPLPFPATLDELERAAALAMLERCDGNKSAAARRLGITRSRLYRLLEAADDGVST